ncbi:MAG: 30S ribosomal protein S3 [Candidatus Magasanikbacteria bacterium RIFOXYC2_FULL_40_16]|uniref:Small ribosomal subunit protein uS3 n=3 Tax=Candidatus Magasanikiibacteriota TaxID=1752731 RepID=A0A1F6NHA2_9BACT|nr:MAG: 30S ribosomal protein S3 [Candidatus Magasanikbacteria bacterium RIFOXYA2_FULL_40_20]OGH83222.1 MAG: 30S ribosomal protein S3 [Candidatus Magasanikbacteria bacterium RIFOXYB1_FULL_40_15]OGH85154.1 MAG: 30S ribosomal protein S3 [Candidatus Magasanikbacteria bacterium RIFOXYB2_FULL_40_13]OGH87288.1 MAG: 30S ribosomal protein S3 [Candidatus Magasanikbacteria bacterium RIFOXYA1_FULL_40_8]OGH89505.1 MAG: 30S ribosomal protein S3 [Candidatus Magasanikbacteria bacterium RIFOXYC2_FULL_40_16]
MGHKVHPRIHRIQVIYTWDSRWFGKKKYAKYAEQDVSIREFLMKKFKDAHIDSIGVERGPKNMTVTVFAAKPGFIIGRGGQGLEDLRKEIERKYLQMSLKVKLNIQEVHSPALSASVIAQTVAAEIEKRMPFRRVMKQSIEKVMKAGAQGVKICLSGRLNGVDIARTEKLSAGKVPLITLRSDVDYCLYEANTTYGKIGVKVWVYHGEIFGRKDKFSKTEEPESKENKEKRK